MKFFGGEKLLWNTVLLEMQDRNLLFPIRYILSEELTTCSVGQSCPTLCESMDCSPPGSSVHGILQAWILWVSMPSSRGSSRPGIEPASLMSLVLAGGFFTTAPPRKPIVKGKRWPNNCFKMMTYKWEASFSLSLFFLWKLLSIHGFSVIQSVPLHCCNIFGLRSCYVQ